MTQTMTHWLLAWCSLSNVVLVFILLASLRVTPADIQREVKQLQEQLNGAEVRVSLQIRRQAEELASRKEWIRAVTLELEEHGWDIGPVKEVAFR